MEVEEEEEEERGKSNTSSEREREREDGSYSETKNANNLAAHGKWKGFCFYSPPPLNANSTTSTQVTRFDTNPMQLCKSEDKDEHKQDHIEKNAEKNKKEDIDTIIENEYTEEMSFLINKISLSEDEKDDNPFMPYIY